MELSTIIMTVASVWGVAVLTPGPNSLVIARMAMGDSFVVAWYTTLGTCTGTICWGVAGFFGISLLFSLAPWVYLALKICGGTYLVWLGLKSLLAGRQSRRSDLAHNEPRAHMAPACAWRLGLITNLTNPKAAAFVTSLFAAALPPEPPLWVGLLCVAVMLSLSLMWYTLLAWMLSGQRSSALYTRGQHWIDRAAGAVFIGFGVRLATGR